MTVSRDGGNHPAIRAADRGGVDQGGISVKSASWQRPYSRGKIGPCDTVVSLAFGERYGRVPAYERVRRNGRFQDSLQRQGMSRVLYDKR